MRALRLTPHALCLTLHASLLKTHSSNFTPHTNDQRLGIAMTGSTRRNCFYVDMHIHTFLAAPALLRTARFSCSSECCQQISKWNEGNTTGGRRSNHAAHQQRFSHRLLLGEEGGVSLDTHRTRLTDHVCVSNYKLHKTNTMCKTLAAGRVQKQLAWLQARRDVRTCNVEQR